MLRCRLTMVGDRDDVIGIRRVPHAEEKAEKQNRKERGHRLGVFADGLFIMGK